MVTISSLKNGSSRVQGHQSHFHARSCHVKTDTVRKTLCDVSSCNSLDPSLTNDSPAPLDPSCFLQ